jgi:hypothetical protein
VGRHRYNSNNYQGQRKYYLDTLSKETEIRGIKFDCNDMVVINQTLVFDKEFTVDCCDNIIRLLVCYKYAGPVVNSEVKITGPDGYSHSAFTDENGWIKVEKLCYGTYKVVWKENGYKKVEQEIKLTCQQQGGTNIVAIPE